MIEVAPSTPTTDPSCGTDGTTDGTRISIRPVRTPQDVREMIAALLHEPSWLWIALDRFKANQQGLAESEVWVDGHGGVIAAHVLRGKLTHPGADLSDATVVVLDVAHKGRGGKDAREGVAEVEVWGKERGATAMLFSTHRHGPWERLLRGFRQVSVTYMKRLDHE